MALVEEISAVVLDGGEPLSFRSLGATAQVDVAASCAALEQFARDHGEEVAALHVTVERAQQSAPTADPRSRVIRVGAARVADDAVLSRQVYALYRKRPDEGDSERLATACWAMERKARREIFAQVDKHAPMSLALKALYSSGVSCAEATARTVGGDQGEETVSAFDAIKISRKSAPSSGFFSKAASSSSAAKPATSSSSASTSSSSSFFKSSASTASKAKSSAAAPARAKREPEAKKLSAESMSNVLSVDSSDEDGSDKEDADAPVFVKKASAKPSRASRVISDDDDDDMEDVEPKSTPVKRKLPAEPSSESENPSPTKKAPVAVTVATTRRVLVTKTRITPEGYMVTDKTYEEQALTPEEVASEQQAALKKQQLAAKASKSAGDKPGGGPRKQKDLRSFFMKK